MEKLNNIAKLKKQNRQKKLNNLHLKFFNSRHLRDSFDFNSQYNLKQKDFEHLGTLQLNKKINKQFQAQSITARQKKDIQIQIKNDELKQEYIYNQNKSYCMRLWKKFIVQKNKITKIKQTQYQKNRVLTFQDITYKIQQQSMIIMDYLLEQQDSKIYSLQDKSIDLQQQIKQLLKQFHQICGQKTQILKILIQNEQDYKRFQKNQKQIDKQRKQMLNQKRVSQKTLKSQYKNYGINLNDLTIQSMIQKKAKLNLQFDLSFQVQQRKKIRQAKQLFDQKNKALSHKKDKIFQDFYKLQRQIFLRQNQKQTTEIEIQKLKEGKQFFFKMLLKNTQHRHDGVIWTLRKMIQSGFAPKMVDFSQQLDLEARQFIIKEYERLKKEIGPIAPHERKKTHICKKKKPLTRFRVKSMIQINNFTFLKGIPQIQEKNQTKSIFKQHNFSFADEEIPFSGRFNRLVRKMSNQTIRKNLQASSTFQINQSNNFGRNIQSLGALTKQKSIKAIYNKAKVYLKTWVNQQGWNTKAGRSFVKLQDKKISDDYLSNQKTRTKRQFYKFGTSNKKYNILAQTLFGKDEVNNGSRRIKTTR